LYVFQLITLLSLSFAQSIVLNLPKWAENNWLDCYTKLGSTFIIFVIAANLLELNIPLNEATSGNNDVDEMELRVEPINCKTRRSASVSAEDAKLVRTSNSVLPVVTDSPKILVLKSKLHLWIQLALQYYHR
ncbi:unnamed protein product, partial [Allacma fusca]